MIYRRTENKLALAWRQVLTKEKQNTLWCDLRKEKTGGLFEGGDMQKEGPRGVRGDG